ncbi:protein translocase subunit SecF [Candidatus Gottesmanbacteria bacterium]|nr:protein translocase subunit SecF [Candidatus Gottesmanbacteria bacterium]
MIRFSKYIWLYVVLSALVLVPGIYSLIRNGFHQSIDFAGGTLIEYRTDKPVPLAVVTAAAEAAGVHMVSLQQSQGDSFLVRMKQEPKEKIAVLTEEIEGRASVSAAIMRNETVGPTLGAELLSKALFAAILAISAILAYVAYAFKNIRFGVAAIIALVHDLFVVLGIFSLLGYYLGVEVDTLFVTAFLTTMSFSVHDTIVVFDRIREYMKRDRSRPFEEITDMALTETMNRSLTNSFTIIFMLVALVLMGGETTKWFVVALLIGTVSGTYSSPFVATPVLLLWHRWEKRRSLRK